MVRRHSSSFDHCLENRSEKLKIAEILLQVESVKKLQFLMNLEGKKLRKEFQPSLLNRFEPKVQSRSCRKDRRKVDDKQSSPNESDQDRSFFVHQEEWDQGSSLIDCVRLEGRLR